MTTTPRNTVMGPAHLELGFLAATVDLVHGAVSREGGVTHLTPLELRLLRHLASVSPRPVDRAELEREVWGYASGVDSHTVLSTVHRLRKKIERDPKRPDHLLTDRGKGYVLIAPTCVRPSALEVEPLPLIGRETTLLELAAAVASWRMVTLVGPGGVGKTRLVRELYARYTRGSGDLVGPRAVRFCELGDTSGPADLLHAIARSIGVHLASEEPLNGLTHALCGLERPVLILDNLEQIIDAARALCVELLRQVVDLTIVGTSREALRIDGEAVLNIRPLPTAEAQALFVDRHQRAAPHGLIAPADLAAIVAACENLPLALELAAARGRIIAPGLLATRLDELLMVPGRNRSDTLEANIRWSWNLLTPAAQVFLGRLAGFASGFTLDAAVALGEGCDTHNDPPANGLDLLDELVRKSLVTAHPEVARFEIASAVRAFARRVSPETGHAARWLAGACESWLAAETEGDFASVREAYAAFQADALSLRAATRWAVDHEPATAERLIWGQGAAWLSDGPLEEGLALTTRALSCSPSGRLELLRGRLLYALGRIPEASEALARAADEPSLEARLRGEACDLLVGLFGAGEASHEALSRAVSFFGHTPRGLAAAEGCRAIAAWYRGEVEVGLAAAERALRGYEALGVARRQVQMLLNRGYFLLDLGRHDTALRSLERGLEGARTGRLQSYLAGGLTFVGMLHQDRGDLERARAAYVEVAHVSRRQGRIDHGARARAYEATLPGPPENRLRLLDDALDLAERAAMPAVEAQVLATWVSLDPSRADLRAQAERLVEHPRIPSPIRTLVRLLLGHSIEASMVERWAMLRLATRVASLS